jgi:hypothetical protein
MTADGRLRAIESSYLACAEAAAYLRATQHGIYNPSQTGPDATLDVGSWSANNPETFPSVSHHPLHNLRQQIGQGP